VGDVQINVMSCALKPDLDVAWGWNTAVIRDLLAAAFDDSELKTLCFGHFDAVYADFAEGMSRGEKIQRLLGYCERHVQMDRLLQLVRERNPAQYARFENRFRTQISES
jgi:hypothetical protein